MRILAEWHMAWRFPVDLAASKYRLIILSSSFQKHFSCLPVCDLKINTYLSSDKKVFNLQTLTNQAKCSLNLFLEYWLCLLKGVLVDVFSLNPITLFGS